MNYLTNKLLGVSSQDQVVSKDRDALELANRNRDAGDFANASVHYMRYIEDNPLDVDILIQAAHMNKEIKNYDLAQELYSRAEQQAPNNPELSLQQGHFYKVCGNHERSLFYYSKATRLRPRWIEANAEILSLMNPEKRRAYYVIIASDSLDQEFYFDRYPHVLESGMDPVVHYILSGADDGYLPNRLFDTSWYVLRNPIVETRRLNPLAHYIDDGARQGLNPHPLFETTWYLETNPELKTSGTNPLVHFLRTGHKSLRDPSPLFNSKWYLEKNPELKLGETNLLIHFLDSSIEDLSDPNPLFDCQWYLSTHQDVLTSRLNPLLHYAAYGSGENRKPNAVFDSGWYTRKYGEVSTSKLMPFAHFLWVGASRAYNPSPDFDAVWYRDTYLSGSGTIIDAVEHYLKVGFKTRVDTCDPNSMYRKEITRRDEAGIAQVPELLNHIEVMDYRPQFAIIINSSDRTYISQIINCLQNQIYKHYKLFYTSSISSAVNFCTRKQDAFVIWLDEGTLLHPFCLYALASRLNTDRNIDIVYTDEDFYDSDGSRVNPFYKPAWSPDYIESLDYIGNAICYRGKLVAGYLSKAAGSYDLTLKSVFETSHISHIRSILFHSRDRWTFKLKDHHNKSNRVAIERHLTRTGRKASVKQALSGYYCYSIESKTLTDLVSVVIPTAGKTISVNGLDVDLIINCVQSIKSMSSYKNIEIIVVHNGDLGKSRERVLIDHGCKLVLYSDRVFNVARKLNLGARSATGSYLLLMNDDIQPINNDWIEFLLGHMSKQHVGVVGAKLLYPDDTMQHAGVVLNWGNPDHVQRHYPASTSGYYFSNVVPRNFSAVTGAVMLTRTELYFDVGGYSEQLAVSYNDVDFCFKIRSLGFSVVYDPRSTLYHFESSSRVPFLDLVEHKLFHERWSSLTVSDPYYNDSRFTLAPPTFKIKNTRRS